MFKKWIAISIILAILLSVSYMFHQKVSFVEGIIVVYLLEIKIKLK